MKKQYYSIFFIYLFAYVQISPAFEQPNYEELEDLNEYLDELDNDVDANYNDFQVDNRIDSNEDYQESTELQKRSADLQVLSRAKRFWEIFFVTLIAGFFGNVVANVIGDQVNKAINTAEGRSGKFKSKAQAIDKTINSKYKAALAFKKRVSRMNPEAGRAIQISAKGFKCDKNYCKRFGNGQNSLGICSPKICHCSNGIPNQQTCGTGTVFDPLYKICNRPYNIKICGN